MIKFKTKVYQSTQSFKYYTLSESDSLKSECNVTQKLMRVQQNQADAAAGDGECVQMGLRAAGVLYAPVAGH